MLVNDANDPNNSALSKQMVSLSPTVIVMSILSGLKHATEVLHGVEGISFTHFTSKDVVRHPLVQKIVDAYDKAEPWMRAN